MTDDERAYRLRCTQLLIDLKGTPHEAQALVEGWGRDERRRVWEEAEKIVDGYRLPDGWAMRRTDGRDPVTAWLERIVQRLRRQAEEEAIIRMRDGSTIHCVDTGEAPWRGADEAKEE